MHQHHVQCVVRRSRQPGSTILWRLAICDFRSSRRRRGAGLDLAVDTSLLVPDAILTCRICLIALRPRCKHEVTVQAVKMAYLDPPRLALDAPKARLCVSATARHDGGQSVWLCSADKDAAGKRLAVSVVKIRYTTRGDGEVARGTTGRQREC